MTQMPVLSALLHRLVPSFSLSMIRVDESFAPREHYSEYFDEFSHRLFAESGHLFAAAGDDPAAFGRLLRNRDPIGSLVIPRPDYLAGGTYQHLFQRNGIHHCLDVAIRTPRGPLGILGLFRERGALPFTTADVMRIREIYADLVHAFEARDLVGPFDELESAVLVVDARGKIEWASASARAWLEEATPGEERTWVRDRAALPSAASALAQGVREPRPGATPPTLTLPVAGGRLRLRAYALAAAGSSAGEASDVGAASKVAIQLTFEAARGLRVAHAVAQLGLAPRLREVALLLYQGETDVARRLGVTRETFKSYRKELYVRLGVESVEGLRAHLDRLALSTRLDLERQRPRADDSEPGGSARE
jgi:DNA-binding CsgD family transcriptional regulator